MASNLRQTEARKARSSSPGMAPAVPSPKPCFLQSAGPEGCKYMTPDGLTFEQQLANIEAHCRYVHP